MKHTVSVLAVVSLLALIGCGSGRTKGAAGVDLSKVKVETIDGRTINLADWIGNVIVVDFWATWCGPCRREIPELGELEKEYRGKGVKFLGLAVRSDAADVKAVAREDSLEFPIALSTAEIEEIFGGIEGVPTTFVFDKTGAVAAKFVGARPKEVFSELFDRLLKSDAATKEHVSP